MKADRFLVMAHGTDEGVECARRILKALNPSRLDVVGSKVAEPA